MSTNIVKSIALKRTALIVVVIKLWKPMWISMFFCGIRWLILDLFIHGGFLLWKRVKVDNFIHRILFSCLFNLISLQLPSMDFEGIICNFYLWNREKLNH